MSRVLPRLVAIAIAGFGMAACTPTASLWSEADARREIGVERVQLTYNVAFAPGETQLSPTEAARLSDFLKRQQVGYGDRVEIQVPTEDPRLAERRAAAVAEALAREGIAADHGVAHAPSGVRLMVSRSIAIPPACPDWRKADDDGDPSNTPMSNLGCANLRNLGLMVADPSELVAGRPLDGGSGEPLAAGVERYRTGKVTPLVKWGTMQ